MAAPPVVRTDGRKPAMMRQLKTERDPLERAHGSARWEQGTHLTVVAPPSFIPEV
jgi:ribonuclease PH